MDYPTATVERLDSGASLYHLRRPGGLVTVSVVSRVGASTLREGRSGLAALSARMMTEGTRTHSSHALAVAVEDLGATLEHHADRDHVRIGLTCRASDFEAALALLAEVVAAPRFDTDELVRVKKEWLDDLQVERQDPTRASLIVGLRLVLGPAAGAPVTGRPSEVRRIEREDLAAFHGRAFSAENVAILVTGDRAHTDVSHAVKRHFGHLPVSPGPARQPDVRPEAPGLYIVDRPGSAQTAIFAGHPFPKRSEPGTEARDVMNNALGGLFTSRLNQNLRESHGYTYGAFSTVVAARDFGLFAVMTSVRADATTEALNEIRAELGAVSEPAAPRPLTPPEIARAKADRVHDVAAHLEHIETVHGDAETLFVQDLPVAYFHDYQRTVERLSGDAIRTEARRISPDALVVVLVGDRDMIEPALRQAGHEPRVADAAWLE